MPISLNDGEDGIENLGSEDSVDDVNSSKDEIEEFHFSMSDQMSTKEDNISILKCFCDKLEKKSFINQVR